MSPPLATMKITERGIYEHAALHHRRHRRQQSQTHQGSQTYDRHLPGAQRHPRMGKGRSVFRSKPNSRLRHPPRANRTIATPCKPSCTNTPASNAATKISSHITYRSSQGPKPHACALRPERKIPMGKPGDEHRCRQEQHRPKDVPRGLPVGLFEGYPVLHRSDLPQGFTRPTRGIRPR